MFRLNEDMISQLLKVIASYKVQFTKEMKRRRVIKDSGIVFFSFINLFLIFFIIVPFRVRWFDVVNIQSRGKWWVVGSSWRNDALSSSSQTDQQDGEESKGFQEISDTNLQYDSFQDPKLINLAKKQGMNTDQRRRIFISIVSSEGVEDCLRKLAGLNLRFSFYFLVNVMFNKSINVEGSQQEIL